jgi:hypothetical protein
MPSHGRRSKPGVATRDERLAGRALPRLDVRLDQFRLGMALGFLAGPGSLPCHAVMRAHGKTVFQFAAAAASDGHAGKAGVARRLLQIGQPCLLRLRGQFETDGRLPPYGVLKLFLSRPADRATYTATGRRLRMTAEAVAIQCGGAANSSRRQFAAESRLAKDAQPH